MPRTDWPPRAHVRPSCGHKRLQECPLSVDDWGEVYNALLGFLFTCRLVAERAHARTALNDGQGGSDG